MEDFNLEKGIERQQRQLEGWKKVLKEEMFGRLEKYCEKENEKLRKSCDPSHIGNGYKVFRGGDLLMFVENNLILENGLHTED